MAARKLSPRRIASQNVATLKRTASAYKKFNDRLQMLQRETARELRAVGAQLKKARKAL